MAAAFPLVDVAVIRSLVGPAAFGRAQAYARADAVQAVDWDAELGRLTADVVGTSPYPYHCVVYLNAAGRGMWRPINSACSCPVTGACKHVAASLLVSNGQHVAGSDALHTARDAPGTRRRHGAGDAGDGAGTGGAGRAGDAGTTNDRLPATLPEADWRSVLGGTPASGPRTGTHTPLALRFEPRETVRGRRSRWQRSAASTVAAKAGSTGPVRIGMRPVTPGARGWVGSEVTWSTIPYQLHRLDLDERAVRWFRHLLALSRAHVSPSFGHDPDRLFLDDFTSPLIWQLLAEAGELGIQLVGVGTGEVTVAAGARISVDAARAADQSIRLTTRATFVDPDLQCDAAEVCAVDTHGLYRLTWESGPRLLLAPVETPISPAQRRMLVGGVIEIPASDGAEFFNEFYPTLQRELEFDSADASVAFPEIEPPTLVLTLSFGPDHRAELRWSWEGVRDGTAEADTLVAAETALGRHIGAVGEAASTTHLTGFDTVEFVEQALPRLEALENLRIDVIGERPAYRELLETPTLTVSTVETDHTDWFDLGVMVHVGDRLIPFEPLFRALSRGEPKLMLVDKSYLSLKQPMFDPLRRLIAEAEELDEWEVPGLHISRYQAGLWADFEDLADESVEAVSWRESVGRLIALTSATDAVAGTDVEGATEPVAADTPLPAGLQASLRPYQHEGYAWLTFLWRSGLGGVLADDMGLGKTLQALALAAHAREVSPASAPFLVVAPTSVVANWAAEAARFTPDLTVATITATQRKSGATLADRAAGADVVITSYTLFRLEFDAYQALEWSGLMLDEAQFVKNHTARAHRCARDLSAPFKLAITGTPMENNLMELWAMFDIVAPGLFPSSRRFKEQYVRPIEASGAEAKATPAAHGAELTARLRRRIRPLMLRRTKETVAPELPPKQEQVLQVELEPKHRRLYDMFLQRERQKLLGLIDDLDRNRFIVFRSLTLLRMLALDATLVDEQYAGTPSSKLDALFEQLDDVLAEGHRTLVFSQFTSFLHRVAARLDERGVAYSYLDGSTSGRAKVIERFRAGDAPVFLISLKAGGFGLNLTEADYVFLLDPWWNPASENQAIDRTHRIGQRQNVMVYRLVAGGTIEEKVMALKERKAKLVGAVLDDDGAFSGALTADDIRGLLE